MEQDIKVSIITVCLNSAETIRNTIESVLAQTYTNISYYIVDGQSSDGTPDIAESYREAFTGKGMRLFISSEKDNGIYDAMNRGIEMSDGELTGIINSDDRYEPEAVEKMVGKYHETHFDLAFADIRMIMESGKTFIKKARLRKYTTSRDWNHPTQFVARRVYDKYRYRCENMSDDMDLYFRVRKAGYRIVVINEVLADFTMGGLSSSIPADQIIPRIKRRYKIYIQNGYSRFYIFECIGFELIKYIGAII